MQIGLVGMPFTGKTTLFNLLTGSEQETGFSGTGEVHTGSAVVPDRRLAYLEELYRPERTVYARIQFKDIPGVLSEGGRAGRMARLLEEVRGADALVQVVRAFCSEAAGEPRPYRELRDFRTELYLADLATVENRIARLREARKTPHDAQRQIAALERVREALEEERPPASLPLSPENREALGGQSFLTDKPLLVVINLDENQLAAGGYPDREKIREHAAGAGAPLLEICALVELEIGRLDPKERDDFMAGYGLEEPGLALLARSAYRRLGLLSFFTVGDDEVRAWTIREGTAARRAAGKVHSDMERGFIRAEVFPFDALREQGGTARVREKGLFRLEGKDYLVQDGDVITFRFNV